MMIKVCSEITVEADEKESAIKAVRESLRQLNPIGTEIKVWAEDRDPRTTPREGDRLKKYEMLRTVVEMSGRSVTYMLSDFRPRKGILTGVSSKFNTCKVTTWINWARDAEVLS